MPLGTKSKNAVGFWDIFVQNIWQACEKWLPILVLEFIHFSPQSFLK